MKPRVRSVPLLPAGKDRIGAALARYAEERERKKWVAERQQKAALWRRIVSRRVEERTSDR